MTPINILQAAAAQTDEVLKKNEQTFQMLQQHMTQLRDQKIALTANKQMLIELISKITQNESKNVESNSGNNQQTVSDNSRQDFAVN